jgi:hypothetical protein
MRQICTKCRRRPEHISEFGLEAKSALINSTHCPVWGYVMTCLVEKTIAGEDHRHQIPLPLGLLAVLAEAERHGVHGRYSRDPRHVLMEDSIIAET